MEESKGKAPVAIGIDERKDATRVEVSKGAKGKGRYEIHKVENCSVIYWEECNGEMKSEYVGHVSPEEGPGKGLANAVFQFFQDRDTDVNSLSILFSDGCSKMTG